MTTAPPKPRRHGSPPFRVVVVHGGPGAPGSVAPVARRLSARHGVLEPRQTARTVPGEVEELAHQVEDAGTLPATFIGHSWGAWLSLLLAAEHPGMVRKLVLVGSAPFRARDAREIHRRRRQRLSPEDWEEFASIGQRLNDPLSRVSASQLRRFQELAEQADSYDPLPLRAAPGTLDPVLFRAVWAEADSLRRSGALERRLREVRAPVVVIHGRNDPHPVRGVVEPLRRAGLAVRSIVLPRCGHEPWAERQARRAFFEALEAELAEPR